MWCADLDPSSQLATGMVIWDSFSLGRFLRTYRGEKLNQTSHRVLVQFIKKHSRFREMKFWFIYSSLPRQIYVLCFYHCFYPFDVNHRLLWFKSHYPTRIASVGLDIILCLPLSCRWAAFILRVQAILDAAVKTAGPLYILLALSLLRCTYTQLLVSFTSSK